MTNPFARPEQPGDETIPLVPESGYADQTPMWSSGYEPTAIDPLTDQPRASGAYTNPVIPRGYGDGEYANPSAPAASQPTAPTAYPQPMTGVPSPYSQPGQAAPTNPQPGPASPYPAPLPNPGAPASALPPYAPAPTYEQPPMAYGAGPFEPARGTTGGQLAPTYSYVYAPQQTEHPNAVITLVMGLLGFMFGITWPIAWYLGAKGNADIRREPQRYRSSGIMTVGMVLGIIGTVLMGAAVLLITVAIIFFLAVGR